MPEVVGRDGETGLLVPPGDPDALAARAAAALGDADAARPDRRRGSGTRARPVHVARLRRGHRRQLPRAARRAVRPVRSVVLTVDFDRLDLRAGHRLSTSGVAAVVTRSRRCAGARRSSRSTRRCAELVDVRAMMGVIDRGRRMLAPCAREAWCDGDALALPFPDGELRPHHRRPRCSSTSGPTSARSPSSCGCCAPVVRSRSRCRPAARATCAGRSTAATTTRPAATSGSTGGRELEAKLDARWRHRCAARTASHALHSPYWWLRCAVGVDDDGAWPVRKYRDSSCGRSSSSPRGSDPSTARSTRCSARASSSTPRRRARDRPSPTVPGIVSRAELSATVDAIAALQLPDGNIPWIPGGHTDPWNLVEAAMALDVGGRHDEARAAYEWLARKQRADGGWHAYYLGDEVEDPTLDTNVTCYVATGAWHHHLATGDTALPPSRSGRRSRPRSTSRSTTSARPVRSRGGATTPATARCSPGRRAST